MRIRSWRDDCLNANGGMAKEAARLHKERKAAGRKNRDLTRELSRKEKALAISLYYRWKRMHRPLATHKAVAPNQVWMWDITYLRGPIRGQFYYLYLHTLKYRPNYQPNGFSSLEEAREWCKDFVTWHRMSMVKHADFLVTLKGGRLIKHLQDGRVAKCQANCQ